MHEDMFINEHKWSDIIKDYNNFLKKIEKLKRFIIEFKENDIIKVKIYLSNCKVGGLNQCPIVVITYNKCIFSKNNRIQKT